MCHSNMVALVLGCATVQPLPLSWCDFTQYCETLDLFVVING